ncbi:GNAT family N-acetyltransferase [Pseudomonas sp. EA_65y_Pfl1_P120]|uniref:GNAT family N-acetyltransferase n=1 Tax=Pseudomonas sp. EA_65y_Pfl1_P120 TaxID=3088693 RepID=UPI0030D912CD
MTVIPQHASNSANGSPEVETDHWIDPLKDGTHVLIRPLEASDREREFAFIKNLSAQSRHFRFLCSITEPGHALMNQLMDINSKQQMAYVALFMDGGHLIEVGVARYASAEGDTQCESAVVVADQWQRKGLGKRLMQHLIDAARLNGFKSMMSMDSAVNSPMRGLAQDLGFESRRDPLDGTQVVYRLALN